MILCSFIFHKASSLFERRSRHVKFPLTGCSRLTSPASLSRRSCRPLPPIISTFGQHTSEMRSYPRLFRRSTEERSATPLSRISVTTFAGDRSTASIEAFWLKLAKFEGHINNLYNTTFWNLVLKGGLTTAEAEVRLSVGKRQNRPERH
jgi:hypothetical protein